ncbi:MAG TPA: secretin and TonB N-terminal domain-containing protein, partial [Tepidisphaeraceae bacterium]|nr:secretin and TonB N-terminal domain-containing protein [Tepidisphaeraceae bacterium]
MIDDAAAATTAAPAAAAASASVDPFAVTPPATLGATKDGDTALTNPSVVPLGDSVPSTNPTTAPAANAGQSISASQVSVSDAGTVEIHVNDANLLEVLRMLSLQSQRNIIASKEVTGTVTANLYNVTVREALDAILHANGYAYRERDNFIYVYTAKELIEMDKEARQLSTQVFHLYYTPAANAVNMIKPVLSTESQVAFTAAATSGIDQTGTKDTGGNSHATEDTIVVTDYTDNLEKVKRIIKDIDRRPQQVLVEATILSATLSDNNALGVDFSVMGGVKFDQILGTPASTINSASTGNLTSGAGG